MDIYIIRHGETKKNSIKMERKKYSQSYPDISKHFNVPIAFSEEYSFIQKLSELSNLDELDKDSDLNSTGYIQCRCVSNFFNKKNVDISTIYCSKVKRTKQSAKEILKYLSYHEDKSVSIIVEESLYDSDDESKKIEELKLLFLRLHRENKKNVVLVTHNHIIDLIRKIAAKQEDIENWEKKKYYNCSISHIRLNIKSNNLSLEPLFWDNIGHIQMPESL